MTVAEPIQLKGSRRSDVALFVCALAAVLAVWLQPVVAFALLPAFCGTAWLRQRDRRLQALSLENGCDVRLYFRYGETLQARLRYARMSRHVLSLELEGTGSGPRRLLLGADRFVRPDDFRRLRRAVREGLRDDARDADGVWSAWRSRWFPDSRG